MDDSFVFGTKGRMRVVDIVKKLARRVRKGARLFPDLNLISYERAFQKASRALKLEMLGVTPHVVRHTGPLAMTACSTCALSVRCRNAGDGGTSKVAPATYEKQAKIMRQLGLMTKQQQVSMKNAAAQFPRMLLDKLAKYG